MDVALEASIVLRDNMEGEGYEQAYVGVCPIDLRRYVLKGQ